MTKIMVTGTAGFIGFHLARRLLEESINHGKEEADGQRIGAEVKGAFLLHS